MKKIIVLLSCLWSVAQAQPGYTTVYTRLNYANGIAAGDLVIPAGGTPVTPAGAWKRSGRLFYDSTGTDTGLYIQHGVYWVKVGGVFTKDRFGFLAEDVRATAARYFSAANQTFILDSLGDNTLFRQRPKVGTQSRFIKLSNSDGTDSAYVYVGGKTVGSSAKRQFVMGVTSVGGGRSEVTGQNNDGNSSYLNMFTNNGSSGGLVQVDSQQTYMFHGLTSDLSRASNIYLYNDSTSWWVGEPRTSALILHTGFADQYARDSLIWRTEDRESFYFLSHGFAHIYTEDSLLFESESGVYRYTDLLATIDTTNFKPGGYDASGNLKRLSYWPGGGGGGSGVTTMAAIGASPNANGATISGSTLNLQPASASFGGVITTGTQTFAGAKTFNSDVVISGVQFGIGGGASTDNVRAGLNALNANTTGTRNVAIGNSALLNNTTGYYTTAIGHDAARSQTTGSLNVAIGQGALYTNQTGTDNVAIGVNALTNNTNSFNVAIGSGALQQNQSTGNLNVAIGYVALNQNTTGVGNLGIGYQTLYDVTTGGSNTAYGFNTGRGITTGSGNLVFGPSVTGLASGLTNNIILASGAGIKLQHNATEWNFTDPVKVEAASSYGWVGRSLIKSPSDGVVTLTDNAGTNFTRLVLGDATSSFPALVRNSGNLAIMLGDASSYVSVIAGGFIAGTSSISIANTNATNVNAFGAATALTIGGTPTVDITHSYSYNATASGNTKTVNFGTGGESGSTTNINIGSINGGQTSIKNSFALPYRKVTADADNILATDYTLSVDNAANDWTITLPDAGTCAGRIYIIKRYDDNSVGTITILSAGGDVQNKLTGEFGGSWVIQSSGAGLWGGYLSQVKYQSNGTNWEAIQ